MIMLNNALSSKLYHFFLRYRLSLQNVFCLFSVVTFYLFLIFVVTYFFQILAGVPDHISQKKALEKNSGRES